MGNVRFNLQMNQNTYQDLVDISNRDDTSVADVVRTACRDYIRRDKKKGINTNLNEKINDKEGEEL